MADVTENEMFEIAVNAFKTMTGDEQAQVLTTFAMFVIRGAAPTGATAIKQVFAHAVAEWIFDAKSREIKQMLKETADVPL